METTFIIFMSSIAGLVVFYLGMKRQRKLSNKTIVQIKAIHALDIQTLENDITRIEEGCIQDKINMRNDFRYDLVELRKLDLNQDGKRGSIAVDDRIQKLINNIDVANHGE